MTKPIKMFLIFAPNGERNYTSLRWTAKDAKLFWTGNDLKEWHKWYKGGWRCYPVNVTVNLFRKIRLPKKK